MGEGGWNSPLCRELSTAGWHFAPRGCRELRRQQPGTSPEGAGLCARARSFLPGTRGAPQAPQPSAELPICHSRSPRSRRSWLHPPLCKCAAARAGWRGGGAGGREGGLPSLPVPGWKLARLGDWRQWPEPGARLGSRSSSLCLGLSPAHHCTFLASRSVGSKVPAAGCLLLSQNYVWEITWDLFSFPYRIHTPLWSMPLPRWSPCYPRVPYSFPCYSVSTSPAEGPHSYPEGLNPKLHFLFPVGKLGNHTCASVSLFEK